MPKPLIPFWAANEVAGQITEPPDAKKNQGTNAGEPEAAQYRNWISSVVWKWIRGFQGSYADIVVGSPTQVTDKIATHDVDDFVAAVVNGDKILFLDGTHSLGIDEDITEVDVSVYFEQAAILDDGTNRTFTMSGARARVYPGRWTGFTAGDIIISGAESLFEAIDLDLTFIIVSNGAMAVCTGTAGGYKRGSSSAPGDDRELVDFGFISQFNDIRNFIINPDGEIAQRGAGGSAVFTSTSNSPNNDDTYLFDRFLHISDGDDRADVSQESGVFPAGSRFSMKYEVETVGSPSEKFGGLQYIPASDVIKLRGQTISFGFVARTTGLAVENLRFAILEWTGTADSPTLPVPTTWGAEGANPTLDASWAYLNTPENHLLSNVFQQFKFEGIAVGSGANNLALMWWVDDTDLVAGDLLYVGQLQLAAGDRLPTFKAREIGEEVSLCERFYEKSYELGSAPGTIETLGQINTLISANGQLWIPARWKTGKRATPTVTAYSPTTGTSGKVYDGTADRAATIIDQSETGATVKKTDTTSAQSRFHWTAEAEL